MEVSGVRVKDWLRGKRGNQLQLLELIQNSVKKLLLESESILLTEKP